MTPGIPGTGIGGLFYILSALAMPLAELVNRQSRGTPRRWRQVARQFAIASGILVALALTAWVILPEPASPILPETVSGNAEPVSELQTEDMNNLVKLLFLVGTFGVLMLVLALVQVLRFLVKPDSGEPTFPVEAMRAVTEE